MFETIFELIIILLFKNSNFALGGKCKYDVTFRFNLGVLIGEILSTIMRSLKSLEVSIFLSETKFLYPLWQIEALILSLR